MSVAVEISENRPITGGFYPIDEYFKPPLRIRAMEMERVPLGTNVIPTKLRKTLIAITPVVDPLVPLTVPRFTGAAVIDFGPAERHEAIASSVYTAVLNP